MRARTNIPGSNTKRGLGKIARTVTEPVPWSTVMSVNCREPGVEYSRPVFQEQRDFRLIGTVQLQLSGGNVAPQLQTLDARLRDVDVDRIDLLDGRHERRGARLHVRTLRDLRHAAATDDRRYHVGVAKVDLRQRDRRLARRNVGSGLPLRGDGVVVVLLADRVRGDQHLEALGLRGRRREIGFRLLQRGRRAVQRGDIGRGVDLVEPLSLS